MKPRQRDSLRLRVLTAAVGLPMLALVIWSSAEATATLCSLIAGLAVAEFCRLSPARLSTTLIAIAMAGAALFPLDAGIGGAHIPALITAAVLGPLVAMVLLPPGQRTSAGWAWIVAGILYIGWTLSLAVGLRFIPDGREWLISGIGVTFAVDTAAYFIGRAFGKRRLAPTISPGKTWEGSIGGFIVGGIAMVLFGLGLGLPMPLWTLAVLGLALGAAAQLGDLAESMLKRSAGAKDAGTLVPGHGGLLDRLDSLLPALAVLYFFITSLD